MTDPTIFVVDPDQHWQRFVREIADSMQIRCVCYEAAEQFLDAYRDIGPGCLVTELRLPGISGLEFQESLTGNNISLPVMFVTAHANIALAVRAMQNGASTLLEKPANRQQLCDEIRSSIARDATIRSINARNDELRRRLSELTDKERQVLDLMLAGEVNKVMATRLKVSLRTVEARRQQVFRKTRTGSVAELVRMIYQLGADPSASRGGEFHLRPPSDWD